MQKIKIEPLIRQKAEEIFNQRVTEYTHNLSEIDSLRLLHELEIHQIELELQNEELVNAVKNEEEATRKFETLYDFAPTGYFTINSHGVILELNINGAKILGEKRSFLTGKKIDTYIHPSLKNEYHNFIRKIFELGTKQECETELNIPGNSAINVLLNGIVSESERAFITAIDITEKKKVEKVLQENEIRLQELNATKDKFFSIIAHDLRGPVTSILGFSELLLLDVKKNNLTNIERFANTILSSTKKTMDLLGNLLEWARMQTGSLVFKPERCEINEIITEAIDLLEGLSQQKTISILYKPFQKTFVMADKEMMGNVFRNLLSNAIKFTNDNGRVEIEVKEGPRQILVRMSDTGVGMTKANVANLFKLDRNFSKKGTHNEQGTGLGLLLCQEFVEKHGGTIWAESETDKGSSFFFTLPVEGIVAGSQ